MTLRLVQLSIDWDFFVRIHIPWIDVTETDEFRFEKWKKQAVASQLMPPPRSWWAQFAEGRRFHGKCSVTVGDSHRFAEAALVNTGDGVDKLIHVDAHHDLGYDNLRTIDCGNWLRHVMERRPHLKVRIIYPDWKGLADLSRRDRLWAQDSLLTRRISFGCWSTDDLYLNTQEIVTRIFICRSSAWTHPRHDNAFNAFVEEVCRTARTTPSTPYIELEGIDPLEPRR